MTTVALTWRKVAPGVWRGRVGRGSQPDLLSAAGVAPRLEGLAQLGEAAWQHRAKLPSWQHTVQRWDQVLRA